jgi:hypothetical protein
MSTYGESLALVVEKNLTEEEVRRALAGIIRTVDLMGGAAVINLDNLLTAIELVVDTSPQR